MSARGNCAFLEWKLVFLTVVLGAQAWAQPVLSYLLPDIGAPGMAVYVEFIAPNSADINGSNFSATDGIYLNNPSDPFRIELVRPADTQKIVFGPCIVSWYGRLISTIAYIAPSATPNSWDWRQLTPEWRIPIRIRTPNGVSGIDTFYIVQPTPAGDIRSRTETVLGRPPLGVRSRRGALLFDSLLLGANTYTFAIDDPDGNSANGNQAYLPVVLMALGPIRGVSPTQTLLSVNANGSDGGPGGGGGGGEFCDISGGGSNGGNGYTGGGRGGNNSPNSYRAAGVGSGPNGSSLNETTGGTDGGAYESSGGGTGHPFGGSGSGCASGPTCSPDGARGGASGVSDNRDGAGGGYATEGDATSTGANNNGKIHGDVTLVPLAGGSGGASGNPRNTTFPFIACGGRGGGGGGALALIGLSIENLRITANGADGSGSGTQNSRRGGSGSGGGICLAAPAVLSNVQAQAIGGGQNAPTGKGGDGRIRCDAPAFNALNSQPSAYQGPTVDTISVATGEFTLQGSGAPGKTILLFAKPSNGVWQLVDSTTVAANARWQYRVRPPANAEYLYLAAAQREQPIPTTRYTARPAAVFSHSSGRRVRILSSPLQVNPATLDMGRISCADGQVRLDSFTIRNPGTLQVSITSASVQNPATGFRIVRPQPVQAILGAGQALTVVVEYRLQPNRYGVQHDTIVVRGISDTVLVRVPVRIVVDSAGIIILAPDSAKSISAIDFAQTCRGIAKERTFIIRLVGTAPTQLIRIATGTSDFTVEQPSKTALAPGDTVFIRLRALPPDTGNYFDTLTIESVLCNQVLHIPLRVQGISSELIGVGDNRNGVVDFGSIRVGRRSTRRIGVFNTSTLDTSIVLFSHQPALPFSWRLFPATTPYPAPIPMRDTLHIDVEFTPTALGIFRDSLVVISQQHGATCPDTVRFILVGQGTLSAIVPSKTLVDFGTIACGFRRDTIWLKNTGNTEATVTFPAVIAGSDAAYFRLVEQPQGDVELRAGDSVRIIIEARIIPQNADGIKTAKLQCTVRDDSVRTLEIPLQLFQQALILEFTPQPYILYDVPINFTSQSQPPLTVRNLSSVEACIADIRLSRPEIVPINRVVTIPPYSASRDLYFQLTPTSLNPIDDTITIILSCPCIDTLKVPIRIIPTNNALSISPRPLDFGIVAPCNAARRTLTVKNNDPRSNATVEELTIVGEHSALFSITGTPWAVLPYTVPPGFTFTVEFEFNPAGTRAGPKSTQLVLRYIINGQEIRDTVVLTGERTVPIEADSILDFGEVKQGDARILPLRLTNNYTRSITYTFSFSRWRQYFSVSPAVLNIDIVTKNATADAEFNAQDIGEFDDTLWVKFTSIGLNCTDSIPVIARAISIPGISFALWLDSLRILNPRDRQVALNIWGQLDTNISLPAAQLLLVLDIPNQLFMPTGVRSRAGRIQSFNSRTHDRHIITITVDTLLTMISPQPAVILQLIGDAMLGDRQCDSMFIVNARWTNAGLKPTTWINRGTGNGQLCVTLCGAGGPRLLGSTLELPLLTIQPNPAQESTTVTIAAAERGSYSLEVISLEGTVIDRRELGVLTAGQQYTYSLNLSSVANGVYLLRLKTPTSIVVRPFVRLD